MVKQWVSLKGVINIFYDYFFFKVIIFVFILPLCHMFEQSHRFVYFFLHNSMREAKVAKVSSQSDGITKRKKSKWNKIQFVS